MSVSCDSRLTKFNQQRGAQLLTYGRICSSSPMAARALPVVWRSKMAGRSANRYFLPASDTRL